MGKKVRDKGEVKSENLMTFTMDNLETFLKEQVITVQFTKRDGSIRVMTATRQPEYIEQVESQRQKKTDKNKQKTNPDLISVVDTSLMEWRTLDLFKLQKIIMEVGNEPVIMTKVVDTQLTEEEQTPYQFNYFRLNTSDS